MARRTALTALLTGALLAGAGPALADHTNPGAPLSPVLPQPSQPALTAGEGTWRFIANLGPMQGTDLEFFSRDGVTYVSGGTLGQGPTLAPGFVGQRIAQLTDEEGAVLAAPKVVADHGSARCNAPATGVTSLQHDVQAVPLEQTQVLIDTTDAVGRCHDTAGGGLEIIDVSGLGTEAGFQPREIGLIRFNGTSHTVTADRDRPGILYNNGADFAGLTWTDVVDIRSCMDFPAGTSLAAKRAACQPVVYRYPFPPKVSEKALPTGGTAEPANCHDITYSDDRLYCAALNASLILDVSNLLEADGSIAGTPLPCTRLPSSATTNAGTTPEAERAVITDCAIKPAGVTTANPNATQSIAAYEEIGRPRIAEDSITFLGTVNHPGRACPTPDRTDCNTNLSVQSTEGVSVSHEADPALGGQFMFVTDERGGGVIPPGSTCAPSLNNPVGNGGMHVFDVRDPSNIQYALKADGKKAVYIGTSPTPSPTFCTLHVIEQIPGEQRVIAAYYDGGTKIVDYFVAPDGTWAFKETASYRLPGANTWASEVFKVEDNGDGTNTYFFTSTSFGLAQGTARGIDVFSWTGPANPLGAQAPTPGGSADGGGSGDGSGSGSGATTAVGRMLPATGADAALLLLAALLLPAAFGVRVLRRRFGGA